MYKTIQSFHYATNPPKNKSIKLISQKFSQNNKQYFPFQNSKLRTITSSSFLPRKHYVFTSAFKGDNHLITKTQSLFKISKKKPITTEQEQCYSYKSKPYNLCIESSVKLKYLSEPALEEKEEKEQIGARQRRQSHRIVNLRNSHYWQCFETIKSQRKTKQHPVIFKILGNQAPHSQIVDHFKQKNSKPNIGINRYFSKTIKNNKHK